MKYVNKIILLGRLGTAPVLRQTKNGMSVTHFSMATSRKIRDPEKPESEQEVTQWHKIVVWGKQGEHCAAHLKKGEPVFVEGNVRTRPYDGKDGTRKYTFEVHAEEVCFIGGKPKATDTVADEAMAV